MSQVSYGTITIIDTTDIARIYMIYAKSDSNSISPSDSLEWSESVATAPGEGFFLWQKTVIEKSGTEEKIFGEPVCITGASGQSVETITNYYCNYGQGQPEEDYSGWRLEVPEYDEEKPNYWIKIVVDYVDDTRVDFQANGIIANFTNDNIGICDSLKVSLDPVQDLHGHDHPWVGGAGKNLFQPFSGTSRGITFAPQDDGTVLISGTVTNAGWPQVAKSYTLEELGWSVGDAFYNYIGNDAIGFAVRFLDSDGTQISQISPNSSGTVPQDTATVRFIQIGARGTVPSAGDVINTVGHYYVSRGTTAPTEWTPYENLCPITGFTGCEVNVSGKNLYGGTYLNYWYLPLPQGTVVRARADTTTKVEYCRADKTQIDYWSLQSSNGYQKEFTLNEDTTYFRFYVRDSANCQITLANESWDYEPFGQTYPVSWQTEAGTVYGGTVDIVSGVLTVDRASVDLGTQYYNYSSSDVRFYTTGLTDIKPNTSASVAFSGLSDIYATVPYSQVSGSQPNDSVIGLFSSGSTNYLAIKDTRYTNTSDFRTALSGHQLVYELATPQTYQLDPVQVACLLGQNNVWSGVGEIEVKGHTLSKVDITIYKDNGLTNVAEKSSEANVNAAEALEKAKNSIVSTTQLWYQTNSTSAPNLPTNHSQIDVGSNTYNNWRSIRPSNNIANYRYYYYCYEYLHGDGTYSYSKEVILDTSNLSQYEIDSLNARIKKIWSNSTGSYMASGIGSNEVDISDSSTYGFNSKSTTTGVSFNYNAIPLTSLGTDGLKLYSPVLTNSVITGNRLDATLTSEGLKLLKGGIEAGTKNTTDYIYVYSHDDATNHTLTINNSGNKSDWRIIAGNKFGVDKAGNLYASNANVEGAITATSLTIGSGSDAYDGTAAINISGYDIEIEKNGTDETEGVTVYLYPILYHNGERVPDTEIDYAHFVWYQDDDTIGTEGSATDGSYLATYGHNYRVVYDFDDGAVGGGTEVQTRTIDPSKYITKISPTGITIHPETWTNQSSYIQLDGNGMELFNSNGNSIAQYGSTARIGLNNSSRFLINNNSLEGYDNNNNKYFEVNSNGLSWGSNTAATVSQFNTLNNYIDTHLAVTGEGLVLSADNNTKVLIATGGTGHTYEDAGTYILNGSNNVLAQFLSSGAQIGQSTEAHSVIDANGQRFYASDGTTQLANIGYGEGTSVGGTDYAPYYTFGQREGTASQYSSSQTYAVGDICIYNNKLYVCRKAITTPKAWNSNDWQLAIGNYSVAEGMETTASGYYSHAEGIGAIAVGYFSHAEGNMTIAGFGSAHAEGEETKALGVGAHSEGYQTIALGYNAHAQGEGTIANRLASTAIGLYNISDTDGNNYTLGNYALIIGNGTDDNARSNALTVDWSGNVWCAGGITATPTAITLTYSQCTTGSYTRCYRIGNMVFLSFNINVTTATASYDYITGLPPALGGGWATSSGFGSGAMTRWWVTTSGTLRADGTPTAGWHNGNIAYICE